MDFNGVIIAAAIVAILGLLIGILLGIIAKVFEVKVDEKEEAIRELLPGNNCGGCGYAGCDSLAKAIAEGKAKASACPVGGATVAAHIAAITGGDVEVSRKVAFVRCAGTPERTELLYNYSGNMTCREAALLPGGGPKGCSFGCLGYGSCVEVCDFGGVSLRNGIAFVNKETCLACGKCITACPRHLIELVPYDTTVKVRCMSTQKGKDVRAVCKTGCIGCKLCEKNCPTGAIKVENNVASINYEICSNCGTCVEKCPAKIILFEKKN